MFKYLLIMIAMLQSLVFSDVYCEAYTAFDAGELAKAKELADPLAFKGDVKAQNLLGLINLKLGNNSAAKKWFQNAGMKKYDKASYNLAIFYYELGNEREALKWMNKAKPLTQAKAALGFLYINTNLSKAKEYFALAAKEGSAFARSHLCVLLVNKQEALDNKYVSLCQGNVLNDLYLIGKFYTSPKKYGSVNKAIYYLELAADKGDVKAMNLLGEMLYKRRGPSDEANALKYFEEAASLGNVDAKVNAAWIYYTGVKWTRNPEKGHQILTKAVNRGNAKAKYYMGLLYSRVQTIGPDNIQQDRVKGLAYIKAAAAQNDEEAIKYMIQNGASADELQSYKKQLKKHEIEEEKARALHFLYDAC